MTTPNEREWFQLIDLPVGYTGTSRTAQIQLNEIRVPVHSDANLALECCYLFTSSLVLAWYAVMK